MTSVKGFVPRTEWHAALLMGLMLRQVHEVFAAEDWKGLRQSHFRVISSVPPEGITITELGDRVGMTKQGCGQFVTQLVQSGHLRVQHSPADRRTRIVHRTATGSRTIAAVTARNLRLEQDWAERVGPERYRVFREVLEELAMSH
ncbi:MAG TPA: MarR family winged helix-turn-helix transcriptional regulator [Nakamurella sp.]